MPTNAPATDRQHYLLAVTNGQPTVVHAYGEDEWVKAINAQETLTDLAREQGHKPSELYYAVRQIDDDQGLVKTALAAAEKPAKAKRVPTRTVEGVTLISKGERYWLSEDGRWEIGYMDDYETECDEPHPVRIGAVTRKWYNSLDARGRASIEPSELRWALQNFKRGYYCRGGGLHHYAMWHAVNTETGEVIAREDTFGQTLQGLGEHLRTGKISA